MINSFCAERLSGSKGADADDKRNQFERDFDRILFSAPVRRLADKTQVFPMEKNDSVRTRLTHSHEVSNLCRSLATQIIREDSKAFGSKEDSYYAPVIAAAVGLAHDLGNPPFGHQGENTIRRWFKTKFKNKEIIKLSQEQKGDFESWEGNAQTLRLLTKLQVAAGSNGLDLTAGTLAALMKYTVCSSEMGQSGPPAKKKFGIFQADKDVAEEIFKKTDMKPGQRHPIAYIMEACDDIAYSTIDIEDAIKKKLVSINDLLVALSKVNAQEGGLYAKLSKKLDELRSDGKSATDINEIGAQYYRTYTIGEMIVAVRQAYLKNKCAIILGNFDKDLIKASTIADLCLALKKFAREHAYNSSAVKEIELRGDNALRHLMDFFWRSILECSVKKEKFPKLYKALAQQEATPFGEFVYSHVSSNYRSHFQGRLTDDMEAGMARYFQFLLLTDMISGMTETFALDVLEKFEAVHDGR